MYNRIAVIHPFGYKWINRRNDRPLHGEGDAPRLSSDHHRPSRSASGRTAEEGNPMTELGMVADPNEVRRSRLQSVSMLLRRAAQRHAGNNAITCGGVTWSYAELDQLVDALCRGLSAEGVKKGDRVA